MYKIISISNRKLCSGDFFERIAEISKEGIPVVLREKDLSEEEYTELARKVLKICPEVILHSFTDAARSLGAKKIHLPMNILKTADITPFTLIGASVHSPDEAYEAQELGASYVTAGHIFETDCKKGISPRGLDFLKAVCDRVNIPVYAIGGINSQNARSAIAQGASGICIMSGLMKCENIHKFLEEYY